MSREDNATSKPHRSWSADDLPNLTLFATLRWRHYEDKGPVSAAKLTDGTEDRGPHFAGLLAAFDRRGVTLYLLHRAIHVHGKMTNKSYPPGGLIPCRT
jgi:hypothetical protein